MRLRYPKKFPASAILFLHKYLEGREALIAEEEAAEWCVSHTQFTRSLSYFRLVRSSHSAGCELDITADVTL